jgi:acyl-CoA reductase-like NAD-dependent aldehyde dehydrogenase
MLPSVVSRRRTEHLFKVASLSEFRILSPVDGHVYAISRYAYGTEIVLALEQAERAFRSWKKASLQERCQLVMALADALASRKERLAEALAWEIGRPLAQADETPRFKLVTEKHIEVAELDAGTVFIDRCDHADLYLPWGGRKRSGPG